MASTDFSFISDVTSSSSIARGAATSAVVAPPNGGASFVYVVNSLVNTPGIVALYSGLANFTPTAKGGIITGAIYKGGAGGSKCSAFLFINLNGQASSNQGYLFGLSDSEPAHLIFRKGDLASGLPDVAPGTQSVYRRSTATFATGTWVHVKLECILQPGGDVVLNFYQSDLATHAVTAPSWAAISGMTSFTDDNMQVNTGTAPITAGRMGFGMTSSEINRIAAFDEITTERQISP